MKVMFIVWLVVCKWCGSDLQVISVDTGGSSQAMLICLPFRSLGTKYSSIVHMFGFSLRIVVGAPSVAGL